MIGGPLANCCKACEQNNFDPDMSLERNAVWKLVKPRPLEPPSLVALREDLRHRNVTVALMELIHFFDNGRASVRKSLSHWGAVQVICEQTIHLSPHNMLDLAGNEIEFASALSMWKNRQTQSPLFYDPGNELYQLVFRYLWSDFFDEFFGKPINAETLGDIIEAIGGLYIRRLRNINCNDNDVWRTLPQGSQDYVMLHGWVKFSTVVAYFLWQTEFQAAARARARP